RVIGDAVFLLEGGIVFLVDDDETEIGEGQEERRARADDDGHAAFRDAAPDTAALARCKIRMPLRRTATEPRLETFEELARECDLRQQDQHLLLPPKRFRHRLEIDFRLAGTRNAVEKRRREALRLHRIGETLRRLLLLGR